ncbi:MAG TPA: alkaline phosphatase D family protein [Polyangiaceae bacterium]|nr:alkaline phosphatase D family protein [Polyangiaceae bacterium]
MVERTWSRRNFIERSALGVSLTSVGALFPRSQAAAATIQAGAPIAAWGLQIGDVFADRALIWSRADRPARMLVEYAFDERFRSRRFVAGPLVLDVSDFTGRVALNGLPPATDVFVRVTFEALDRSRAKSEPVLGRFRTAPNRCQNVRFVWGGDTAGQGWGIDLEYGGMRLYEAMRKARPDFFLHSGDNIYADGPMVPEVKDAAGAVIWRNAFLDVVPEKLKVAETLNEYRRAYLYNRYDQNVVLFNNEVPQIWQWDDHEVINNWSPSKQLDARYTTTDVRVLVANARRAFLEYSPLRWNGSDESGRVYRQIPYGDDLDIFVLDMRSYRAGNGCNVETAPGPETAFLGRAQLDWLKRGLRQSRATWKIIAADMPLGLVVADGTDPVSGCARFENSANGDGPVLGREFEIAELLRFLKRAHIDNVVWLTADVHYCAAHYYDPSVAVFQDFDPFWEFVSGPLHAGTFGPNPLDNTFGPTVIFQQAPEAGQANLPPSAGLQFFGQVDLDQRTKTLRVALKNSDGVEVFVQELEPGMRW